MESERVFGGREEESFLERKSICSVKYVIKELFLFFPLKDKLCIVN